jgi:disulfide bond formation protein DsbB
MPLGRRAAGSRRSRSQSSHRRESDAVVFESWNRFERATDDASLSDWHGTCLTRRGSSNDGGGKVNIASRQIGWPSVVVAIVACGALVAVACTGKPAEHAATKAQTVDVAKGKTLFVKNCSTCHGENGQGVAHLGKDLTKSAFVGKQNDHELVAFVGAGRAPGDPLNTTGIAMPPKGGNPALSEGDITAIVGYLRTLHAGS